MTDAPVPLTFYSGQTKENNNKQMEHFLYYACGLVVLILGFLIVKKVATCMFKAVVGIIVLAILAGIYFLAT